MLSVLRQIHTDLANTTPIFPDLPQRKNDLFQLFGQIARISEVSDRYFTYNISHGSFCSMESLDTRRTSAPNIRFSPLLLVNPIEIPEEFRTLNLQNRGWCQRFKDWLSEKAGLKKTECSDGDTQMMDLYFRLLSDPEKAKHALKHFFSTSLIAYKDVPNPISGFLGMSNVLLFCSAFFLSLSLITVIGLTGAFFMNLAIITRLNANRTCENDLRAIELMAANPQEQRNLAEGALFFMQERLSANAHTRARVLQDPDSFLLSKWSMRMRYKEDGELRGSYLLFSNRITNMQNFLSRTSQPALTHNHA